MRWLYYRGDLNCEDAVSVRRYVSVCASANIKSTSKEFVRVFLLGHSKHSFMQRPIHTSFGRVKTNLDG